MFWVIAGVVFIVFLVICVVIVVCLPEILDYFKKK